MRILKKAGVWAGVFLLVFALSMDFWTWNTPTELGALGLPAWIFKFAVLQLVLMAALWLFVRTYWQRSGESD